MKREIRWGSPKEYQHPRTVQDDLQDLANASAEPPVKNHKKHNAKYCKFLKGPHVFGDWEMYHYSFEEDQTISSGKWRRFCVGCHRNETWYASMDGGLGWNAPKEELAKLRPPGYIEKSTN